MTLEENITKQPKENLKKASLCFLLKENQILLAMKKRGFAMGKWNGVGGKFQDTDKNILRTAKRETHEEICVMPTRLKKVAVLNFYHESNEKFGQQVHVFVTYHWKGSPSETDEMAPRWFNIKDIPYDKMWWDDALWLPKILDGKIVQGDFLFNSEEKLIDYKMTEVA